ncbi:MAG: hypothetical protein F6J89_26145, partial [Symploca sp. SIO1C4]|nr:hypothetical protein [Symploca sp. SIO1C4]
NKGSIEHPWATVNHAANTVKAGEKVYIRAGIYTPTKQIRAKHSGTKDAWIIYSAFPGERVIIDVKDIQVAPPSGKPPFAHDQIDINYNLVFGQNSASNPIYTGWPPDNYANIYGTNGNYALVTNPQFIDPQLGNFYLRNSHVIEQASLINSPNTTQTKIGAFPYGEKPDLWWQDDFPPKFSESLN